MLDGKITIKEVEHILSKLGYFDINFISRNSNSNIFWYDAYLDTYYRIQVTITGLSHIEVWDCIYEEDNFVRSGIAEKIEGEWKIYT